MAKIFSEFWTKYKTQEIEGATLPVVYNYYIGRTWYGKRKLVFTGYLYKPTPNDEGKVIYAKIVKT